MTGNIEWLTSRLVIISNIIVGFEIPTILHCPLTLPPERVCCDTVPWHGDFASWRDTVRVGSQGESGDLCLCVCLSCAYAFCPGVARIVSE